jgi:hypothetical protein
VSREPGTAARFDNTGPTVLLLGYVTFVDAVAAILLLDADTI